MHEFFLFFLVGALAQLADGALGMGFGVISSSILLAQGVSPPLVSATVNAAKIPTGLTATLSHWLNGNLDKRLVLRLAPFGVGGGLAGALLLTSLDGLALSLLISAYLLGIGGLVLARGLTGRAPALIAGRRIGLIGGTGGLIEGIGGSWGPIVTTGLIASGTEPRRAIGSSALAEVAVSVAVFLSLAGLLRMGHWGESGALGEILWPLAGLVAGAVPAAFVGGRLAAIAPRRPLMVAVGLLAGGIGLYRLWHLI